MITQMRFLAGSAQLPVLNAPPWPNEPGDRTLLADIFAGSSTTQNPSPQGIPGRALSAPVRPRLPPPPAAQRAGLLARHFRDSLRLQDALAIEDALVEHHLIKPGDVLGGREEPGPTQRRTLAVRHGRAVKIRDCRLFQLAGLRVPAIAVRPARFFLRCNPEARVLHSQREEHALLKELVKRHPTLHFNHTP